MGRADPMLTVATAFTEHDEQTPATMAEGARAVEEAGAEVKIPVDATNIPAELGEFDTVTFQFPHPGGSRAEMSIRGKILMRLFFESAAARLSPEGQVVVTLRSEHYVQQWNPVGAAERAGLRLDRVIEFRQSDYDGYGHVTTEPGANPADVSRGSTFILTPDTAADSGTELAGAHRADDGPGHGLESPASSPSGASSYGSTAAQTSHPPPRVLYILHEDTEIKALKDKLILASGSQQRQYSGFDFMGKGFSECPPSQQLNWRRQFMAYYLEAHSKALNFEFDYLKSVAEDATGHSFGRTTIG